MGLIDSALNFAGDAASGLADAIGSEIFTAISNAIGWVMYQATRAAMWLLWILQELFNVFSGTTKVQYDDEYTYLIDVFFQNRTVNNVYWGIALLGVTFVIVFTIIAVIRKAFDLNDKYQNQSMGAILGAMFKSILTMLLLSIALSAAVSLVNLTINRISYIFDNADSFSQKQEIRFTDEQYATMARIYMTIGNYSMNPSYTSRYNLNSCYNDIRGDLRLLEQQGVFDMVYITKENGEEIDTWQSVLQELVYATDTSHELMMDVRYPAVSDSLLHIMEVLRTNGHFYPIDSYKNGYTVSNSVGLDRIIFLSGTSSAARNSKYNENPYLMDGLRGAFYCGEKDIYSYDEVDSVFDTGLGGISYIFIWLMAYFTLRSLFRCVFGCISRIFNMVSLYLISPLVVSTMPLDNGEKFKQWVTAMTVQSLTILGAIIPMRLVLLFTPIILSSDLLLFDSITMNMIAKALLIVGSLKAVDSFGDMINGILANNVGMAALSAGRDAMNLGNKAFDMTMGAAKTGVAKTAALGAGALKFGSDITGLTSIGRGLAAAGGAIAGAGSAAMEAMRSKGGLFGATISALRGSGSDPDPGAEGEKEESLNGTGDSDQGPSDGDNQNGVQAENLNGTGDTDEGPATEVTNGTENNETNDNNNLNSDNLNGLGETDQGPVPPNTTNGVSEPTEQNAPAGTEQKKADTLNNLFGGGKNINGSTLSYDKNTGVWTRTGADGVSSSFGKGIPVPPPLPNRPGFSRPGSTYSQPTNNHTQSNGTYSQPSNNHTQSNGTFSQPTNSYSQPTNSYSQPTNSYSQPTSTYTQPNSVPSYSSSTANQVNTQQSGTHSQQGGQNTEPKAPEEDTKVPPPHKED